MEMTIREFRTAELEPETETDDIVVTRPVDLVHLARYTLGDRDLECEILQLFCRQSVICLERMKNAQSDKEWKAAAHTIKGSARGVGAWQVASVAEAAEKLKGEMRTTSAESAIAALQKTIEAANDYIRLLTDEAPDR